MKEKNYEITITTTAVSPRGEVREGGGRMQTRRERVGLVLEKMARERRM